MASSNPGVGSKKRSYYAAFKLEVVKSDQGSRGWLYNFTKRHDIKFRGAPTKTESPAKPFLRSTAATETPDRAAAGTHVSQPENLSLESAKQTPEQLQCSLAHVESGTTPAPDESGSGTTPAPDESGSGTTPAPDESGSGTTLAPDVSGTTLAPDVSGTTLAPDVSGTTLAPDESGTTLAPDVSGTTLAPDESGMVLAPVKSGTILAPDESGSGTTLAPDESGMVLAPVKSGTTLAPDESGSGTILGPEASDESGMVLAHTGELTVVSEKTKDRSRSLSPQRQRQSPRKRSRSQSSLSHDVGDSLATEEQTDRQKRNVPSAKRSTESQKQSKTQAATENLENSSKPQKTSQKKTAPQQSSETVHFIGIGGIGMSGIAEVLHNLGYQVQGSDQAESANVQRLREKGIKVFVSHAAGNLGEAEVVVVSTAIKNTNVELIAAREQSLPIVRRGEMLAELMRFRQAIAISGTHGKTTTTAMVATLLEAGGLDPTVIIGGIINAYGSNARMGEGDWMVVEADESDGTFLKLPADVVVVTNIDPEHLDHYGSFDKVREAFKTYVENVPSYGFAVMCIDHPEVQALVSRIEDVRVVSYGESPKADVRYSNRRMDGATSLFDVTIRDRCSEDEILIERIRLPMPGQYNVANATAAIAVASQLGLSADEIRGGLASFGGVKRRFIHTGSWNGVDIFDDYAHHPEEIRAALAAAREACSGKVIAIAQPHRYTRLKDLFDEFSACFNDADTVLIAPVYPAGEDPIVGADAYNLASNIRAGGHCDARDIEGPEAVAPIVRQIAGKDDFVLFLGAGNITQWAYSLADELIGE